MRALVTGGRGGIGWAAASALRNRGYEVIAHGLRSASLEQEHTGVTHVSGDLMTDPALAGLSDALGAEPLDCVVVAHGVQMPGPLTQASPQRVRLTMEVNTVLPARILEATLANLEAAAGAFIVVVSQAGLVAERDNGVYCASKFALMGWLRAVRPRLATHDVRVRALCPGSTETDTLRWFLEEQAKIKGVTVDEMRAKWVETIPLGRTAAPSEIGEAAALLADLRGAGPLVFPITGGQVRW